MKQTVLHPKHEMLKAKMADIQGWQVPLQYSDLQDEYQAARNTAGLFDISCLGRIEVSGPDAESLLQAVLTRDLSNIAEGTAHYTLLCNESAFLLDDAVVFRYATDPSGGRYLLTTNAVNTDKVLTWLRQHARGNVQIVDRTLETAQLALQGPRSVHILEQIASVHFKKIKPRSFRELTLADTPVLVSRSAYMGEPAYELILAADRAARLWDSLLDAGAAENVRPCGFAARDALRMEMGHLLYGYDIDERRTAVEAGLLPFADLKTDFIGRDALVRLKTEGPAQLLIGFMLLDTGIPRNGGSIFSENREIGVVTSGVYSPHVRKGIGLGYVARRYAQSGQEIEIEIRDREVAAKIVDLPFYRDK